MASWPQFNARPVRGSWPRTGGAAAHCRACTSPYSLRFLRETEDYECSEPLLCELHVLMGKRELTREEWARLDELRRTVVMLFPRPFNRAEED